MRKYCFFLFFFFFLSPFIVFGNTSNVVINEIAWMGTGISSSDEWIELYNNTDTEINLDGWGLYEEGGKTLIEPLSGIIGAKSYYLIERTNDDTVPNIEASQPPTSWGGYGLNNNGEYLQLLDSNSNVIDEINCSNGWFAGNGKPEYKTMGRINPLTSGNDSSNWQNSQNPGGTPHQSNFGEGQAPKAENSSKPTENRPLAETPTESTEDRPLETELVEDSPPPTILINYPTGIIFNEILPSSEGPDDKEEWIEIFNQNNFEVDLSGWKIKDAKGSIKTYVFQADAKIAANGYLVLTRPVTKIILNNTGDKLTLIQPDDKIIDEVVFEKALRNQSYSKRDGKWYWTSFLTPGKENDIEETKETETTKETKEINEDTSPLDKKQLLSSLNRSIFNLKNPVSIILVALAISIFAVIIIILFLFFNKKN